MKEKVNVTGVPETWYRLCMQEQKENKKEKMLKIKRRKLQ